VMFGCPNSLCHNFSHLKFSCLSDYTNQSPSLCPILSVHCPPPLSQNIPLDGKKKICIVASTPSSMAFFSLCISPVSSTFSIVEAMCCTHDSLAQFSIVILILPHLFAQGFRPLWPFFAASGITYYLVSKVHDIGVRCASFCPTSNPANSHLHSFSYPVSHFPF